VTFIQVSEMTPPTWVKLTSTGWRLSFRATAADPGPYRNSPAPDAMGRAMSEISLTDDAGRSHDLRAAGVGWSRDLSLGEQEWHGHVVVARDPASRPEWFELAPAIGGGPGRVAVPSPAQVPVGRSGPPWPTPAEGYLAALAPVTSISIETGGTVAEAGPAETAEIVATVADSLIAVGALPVTSTLLRESPASGPGWHVPGWEAPGWHAHATYRRTVLTSTPRLRATSTFGRPAYQCCKISVTSTIVNVLLAISGPPSGSGRKTHSARRTRSGTSPTTPAPRETLIEGVGNYLIAAGP